MPRFSHDVAVALPILAEAHGDAACGVACEIEGGDETIEGEVGFFGAVFEKGPGFPGIECFASLCKSLRMPDGTMPVLRLLQ